MFDTAGVENPVSVKLSQVHVLLSLKRMEMHMNNK